MKQNLIERLEKSFLDLWPGEPTEDHQFLTDRVRRSISWAKKSLSSPHYSAVRFAELWIALNALYGRRRYDERGPTGGMRATDTADFFDFVRLIEKIDSESPRLPDLVDKFAEDALELIENQFLWLAYWREEAYPRELRRDREKAEAAIRGKKTVNLLQLVFPRLLVLRNQILHGSASENTQRNRWALRPAIRVLEGTLPSFLGLMIHNGKRVQWPPIPFPGLGTPHHPVRR